MKTINVVKDYTRFPAGRYRTDGPFSGQRFREEILVPALQEHTIISVQLDGAAGYGSSFLEEAFGGLIRTNIVNPSRARDRLRVESVDQSLIEEIYEYMQARA